MVDYINDCIAGAVAGLKEWTRDMIREWVANLLTSTTIARASESDDDPLHDDAEGWSSTDDMVTSNAEGGENSRPRVRRMEPPCFAYVPLEKEPIKTVGMFANLLGFPVASTRYRPKGLKQSEWAIYNLRAAGQQLVMKGDRESALTVAVGGFLHVELNKNGEVEVTSRAGARMTMNAAGKIELSAPGGAAIVMDQDTLATTLLRATHFGGNSAAVPPTAAPGAALAGGVATCIGNDAAFLVSMVVKAPGGASGTLCTITFGTPYDSPPQFSIAAASAVLVVPAGLGAISGQASNTQLVISTALPIATGPLLLSVLVKQ